MTTLTGGCHCGRVRFEVDVQTFEALDCNCSICTKKGFLHLIVPRERFRFLPGIAEAATVSATTPLAEHPSLTTYTFNTHTAKHTFCTTCGIHGFYVPRSHPDGVDVNVRALDGDDPLARFRITPFDGRRWEDNVASIR